MLLRAARADDVALVASVMQSASRSHLDRSLWEYLYDIDEPDALRFLRRLAVTESVHPFHLSRFTVLEVDGARAGAACGFDPATQGWGGFGAALVEVIGDLGFPEIDAECERRNQVMLGGFPPPPVERPWTIENVAVLPAHRGLGLARVLVDSLCERGGDHDVAQIGLFLGNESARRAYLRCGFAPAAERRSEEWEREIGCPGNEVLLKPLR